MVGGKTGMAQYRDGNQRIEAVQITAAPGASGYPINDTVVPAWLIAALTAGHLEPIVDPGVDYTAFRLYLADGTVRTVGTTDWVIRRPDGTLAAQNDWEFQRQTTPQPDRIGA